MRDRATGDAADCHVSRTTWLPRLIEARNDEDAREGEAECHDE